MTKLEELKKDLNVCMDDLVKAKQEINEAHNLMLAFIENKLELHVDKNDFKDQELQCAIGGLLMTTLSRMNDDDFRSSIIDELRSNPVLFNILEKMNHH